MINNITKNGCAVALSLLAVPAVAGPKVLLETTQGNITLELNEQRSPKTVENFLRYVNDGFYTGTVFHRVIKGFMIQGGGMDANLQEKSTHASIMNEADNELKNLRGSIAMARTMEPHSATAQFFINLVDNKFLDFRMKNVNGWGYTVFGNVIEGMETVDKIAKLSTTTHPSGMQDVPVNLPVIKRASRIVETAIKP